VRVLRACTLEQVLCDFACYFEDGRRPAIMEGLTALRAACVEAQLPVRFLNPSSVRAGSLLVADGVLAQSSFNLALDTMFQHSRGKPDGGVWCACAACVARTPRALTALGVRTGLR
jgi:hypothetical protein